MANSADTLSALLIYDMIFIYCNWLSTLWQWLGNLYKYGKETAIYKRRNHTEMQNTQKRKQKCVMLASLSWSLI